MFALAGRCSRRSLGCGSPGACVLLGSPATSRWLCSVPTQVCAVLQVSQALPTRLASCETLEGPPSGRGVCQWLHICFRHWHHPVPGEGVAHRRGGVHAGRVRFGPVWQLADGVLPGFAKRRCHPSGFNAKRRLAIEPWRLPVVAHLLQSVVASPMTAVCGKASLDDIGIISAGGGGGSCRKADGAVRTLDACVLVQLGNRWCSVSMQVCAVCGPVKRCCQLVSMLNA